MERLKNKATNLHMSWPVVILFAVITGAYTGLLTQVGFLEDTSFRDICVSHEWWILFAMLIIINQKSWIQAGLKTLVFFVISQSVVFLVEWPFVGEFYFPYWYRWMEESLLTLPGGAIMWFSRKKNLLGNFLTSLPLCLLLYLGILYGSSVITAFPHHILTVAFCFAQIGFWLYVICEDKKNVLKTVACTVLLSAAAAVGLYFYSQM